MVPNYLEKIVKNGEGERPKNVESREKNDTFLSLVTTTVISIH